MSSANALVVVLLILAVGDYISVKTKSLISAMLTSSVILLVGFWTKLPVTLFEDAGLLKIGGLLMPFLIVNMGTLLSVEDLKREWKTVVIALGAVVGIGVSLVLLGSPLVGREYAIAAAPPISGGVVAAIIMGERAAALGMESMFLFVTLLVVMQKFFGMPIASALLKKEARRVLGEMPSSEAVRLETVNLQTHSEAVVETRKKRLPLEFPENLQTSYILMAKMGVVVFLAFKVEAITKLNVYVASLFLGVIFKELGFLEDGIMTKANSFGLGMISLMAVVFNSTSTATPQVLKQLIAPILICLSVAVVGIVIFSAVIGKFLNYSKEMSISIGLSALFGFPATFVLSSEVSNAVGNSQEEKDYILSQIMPKMLVSGFVTVTIASVLLASVMVNML